MRGKSLFLVLSVPKVVLLGGIQFLALPNSVTPTRASDATVLQPHRRKAMSPDVTVSSNEPAASGEPSAFNPECPYVIPSEEEAWARSDDSSIPGNVLLVREIRFGRMGNHLIGMANDFQLGYCCKSKMVMMPPKDDIMAPGIFNEGTPGPRFFDFSSAPDVNDFNASTCPASLEWFGRDSLYLTGLHDEDHPNYTPGLKGCMNAVPRISGCEAAYWLPMDVDICGSLETPGHDESASSTMQGHEMASLEDSQEGRKEAGDGNLVVHVRSGDIFKSEIHRSYGQPPLQYYLRLIEDHDWDRVDVVTSGIEDETHAINPVIPVLESLVATGVVSGDIHIHKNRSMAEDVSSMLCADALAMAHSSLSGSLAYLTSATRIYFPFSCSSGYREIEAQRPGTKVYGMSYDENNYSPYHGWNNSAEQLEKMMSFDVSGFEECVGSSDPGA